MNVELQPPATRHHAGVDEAEARRKLPPRPAAAGMVEVEGCTSEPLGSGPAGGRGITWSTQL